LKSSLPESCLCLWLTTLPIGSHVSGGFLLPELDFYNDTLRFDVVISNFHAQQVANDHNIDVLDLHHHFRELTNWRKADGIHWGNLAHRRITQLILTHVCESWGVGLPQRRPGLHHLWEQYMHEDRQEVSDINHNRVRPNRVHERSTSCVANFDHLAIQPESDNSSNVAQQMMQAAQQALSLFAVGYIQGQELQNTYGGGPTRARASDRVKPYRR
jgi:hypothetical protein